MDIDWEAVWRAWDAETAHLPHIRLTKADITAGVALLGASLGAAQIAQYGIKRKVEPGRIMDEMKGVGLA